MPKWSGIKSDGYWQDLAGVTWYFSGVCDGVLYPRSRIAGCRRLYRHDFPALAAGACHPRGGDSAAGHLALALSPKAKVRWRLRTRVILIHLAYLIGSYALWLSIAHTGATQYLFWPAIMLGLSAVSIVLVLSTRGRVVPHPRPLPGGPA
ncbi:hypothetical protein, partial [Arthrobacter sp. JCM 19049]|uniref:hypothetical protein n=1 Tax=Arthrobacter sp. JCM 19049 TaxID=1460643 RepID=UPI000AE60914